MEFGLNKRDRRPRFQQALRALCLLALLVRAARAAPADSASAPYIRTIQTSDSTGAIEVSSEPPEAEIILDGTPTALATPAILADIDSGWHTLEVTIPNYLFSRRRIHVAADSMTTVSFRLISTVDTAYIIGDYTIGVLLLDRLPPKSPPYLVDGLPANSREIALNFGKHRVQWDGRTLWESLDTVVEVLPGKVTRLRFSPRRLTGILTILPDPPDAEVIVDGRSYGYGPFSHVMPTGPYRISVERIEYYPEKATAEVLPDQRITLDIALRKVPDRDHDGFLDTLDHCPDDYGLYAGCPRPRFRDAMVQNARRIKHNVKNDPFAVSCNALAYLYRTPMNNRLREVLSYFSDGPLYMNNVAGVVVANRYAVSYRGFHVNVELGQWNTGLRYRKRDTLSFETADETYHVYFDSLAGVEPAVLIPSTAVSAGAHFRLWWLDIGYALGCQWEDIILEDLELAGNGSIVSAVFDNDWWFHHLLVDINIDIGERIIP
ncbi:MAG: PEGA domain-containing protein, partial [Chitinivibrionales bacterium]|nr:PEGA domain-containing protein [Chitinivibrionales bacterium]MBD3394327.1 PEGA domain-containing protein [Chitinivibrionales bacterium]